MGQVNTSNSWQKAKVASILDLASKIKEVTFELPTKFDFTPGQYIKVRLQTENQNIERYYSVSSATGENVLKIAVEKTEGGALSQHIHKLQTGELLEIKGPTGEHFQLNRPKSVFISGGIGIAPFMSIDEKVAESSLFLASFRLKKEIPWIEKLGCRDNVKLFVTREKNLTTSKYVGFIPRRMTIADIKDAVLKLGTAGVSIYICGSTSFVESIKREIAESELTELEVFTEMFG